jgi:hypothetical protein
VIVIAKLPVLSTLTVWEVAVGSVAGATHNFWLARTDAGGQVVTYPLSEITTPVDPATTVNALTQAAQLSLVSQWTQAKALQAVLDADATTLGVSPAAYDTAISNLSATLVTAGAPATWATTWPSTAVFYAQGIQTTLATLWGTVSAAQATLQAALYAAASSSAVPCAIGDGATTTFLYAGGTVKINGVATVAFTVTSATSTITFTTAPALGAIISGCTTNAQAEASAAQSAVEAAAILVSQTQAAVAAATVSGLTTVYTSGQSQLSWNALSISGVTYEIRLGTTYASAAILGNIAVTNFATVSDGTYWVTPNYSGTYGTPVAIVVTGSTLVTNVVATSNESGNGWLGVMSGGAFYEAGTGLALQGAVKNDSLTALNDSETTQTWDFNGGAQSTGAYEVPSADYVDLGNVQVCTVSATYTAASEAITAGFGGTPSADCAVQLWIAVAQQNGVFGAYQVFVPGQYSGRIFKMKLVLTSTNPNVTPLAPTFTWSVDVPDKILTGTAVACPATGLTVTYSSPFQIRPNLQITILSATSGDYAAVTGDTASGFTVVCYNASTAVARTIHWCAQAY